MAQPHARTGRAPRRLACSWCARCSSGQSNGLARSPNGLRRTTDLVFSPRSRARRRRACGQRVRTRCSRGLVTSIVRFRRHRERDQAPTGNAGARPLRRGHRRRRALCIAGGVRATEADDRLARARRDREAAARGSVQDPLLPGRSRSVRPPSRVDRPARSEPTDRAASPPADRHRRASRPRALRQADANVPARAREPCVGAQPAGARRRPRCPLREPAAGRLMRWARSLPSGTPRARSRPCAGGGTAPRAPPPRPAARVRPQSSRAPRARAAGGPGRARCRAA